MMKKNIHVYFLLVLLMSLTCCRKSLVKPATVTEDLGLLTMGEAKDFIWFKKGTWRIYKNSLTGEIDTMLVTYSILDTLLRDKVDPLHPPSRIYDLEYINYTTMSSRDNAVYKTYLTGANLSATDYFEMWEFNCDRDSGYAKKYFKDNYGSTQFFYPFYTNEHNQQSGARFIELKDSMLVAGKTYYNVATFNVQQDGSYPYPNFYIFQNGNSVYYWARNVGLIQIDHQSYDRNFNPVKMSWEMIDARIIK